MARFGLKDDLGELDSHPTHYDVDDATRDRLIAHTRQDVAMAYYAIRNTKQAVKGLRNIVWVLGLTNLFLLVVLVFR